ncbi:MAG: lipopolysaccharide biosynthesis protein [Candidatus Thorarchaeota archaeon]
MTAPNPSKGRTEEKTELLKGSVFMSISPVTSLVMGLLVTWVIQVYITPEQYGVFEWFNVLSSFFITIIPFQLPNALGRYIAVSRGENNETTVEGLVKTSTMLALVLVPLSGLTSIIFTPYVLAGVGVTTGFSYLDILIFTFGVMSLNLSAFTVGITSGFQEFKKLGIGNFLSNTISQTAVVILILTGWGIQALLLKFVLTGLILSIFLSSTLRKIWSLKGSKYSLRPLISFAYPAILAFLIAYTLNELLIRAIFQYYSDLGYTAELGLFGFASRLMTFINALTLGYYNTLGIFYSEAFGYGGKDQLNIEVKWTLKMSFFLFMPIIIGSVIISPAIFLIVFPSYYWAYLYFSILMFQLVFYLFVRPYTSILGALAKTKQVLASAITASIVSAFGMYLAMNYGLIVTVIAYSSGSFIQALVTAFWVKFDAKINLGIRQVLPITFISLFSILPAAVIHFLRLNPFLELLIIGAMFIVLYIGCIRYLGWIRASEIQKATLFLPKKLSKPAASLMIRIFTRETSSDD